MLTRSLPLGGWVGPPVASRPLRDAILEQKASGLFLWVVLVVDRLLKDYDEGMYAKQLMSRLSQLPAALGVLFTALLSKNNEDPAATIRFYQWAILRLHTLRVRKR
ncbi:hypothetical protein B0H67DRAFT_102958 [Lasiosphaeris hirsuta]|uniref:Uncharacterized protein n=1 Tax=Lasiosphaeris hirsuta TaxID=260670 RepID=A0AA40E6K4_9PEZI|nr:hypothetical protein B0H67DRAFT_102958 [Lasiosphaeris hirsuta]